MLQFGPVPILGVNDVNRLIGVIDEAGVSGENLGSAFIAHGLLEAVLVGQPATPAAARAAKVYFSLQWAIATLTLEGN